MAVRAISGILTPRTAGVHHDRSAALHYARFHDHFLSEFELAHNSTAKPRNYCSLNRPNCKRLVSKSCRILLGVKSEALEVVHANAGCCFVQRIELFSSRIAFRNHCSIPLHGIHVKSGSWICRVVYCHNKRVARIDGQPTNTDSRFGRSQCEAFVAGKAHRVMGTTR